jgi:drug/metabolite transporter (DMT)-like permease
MLLSLVCVLGLACGQLLFKKAAAGLGGGWQAWLLNGWLWAALLLYGAMTLLWIWLLRHTPLYLAYPFMALSFVVVPLLARLVLGEPAGWQTLAGALLIIAGVVVSSWAGRA